MQSTIYDLNLQDKLSLYFFGKFNQFKYYLNNMMAKNLLERKQINYTLVLKK